MNKYFLIILTSICFQFNALRTSAQNDTLPDFSVLNVGGTIYISWNNPYKNTIQINIQRSKESNKNFITIHSTPDASAKKYKYTDKSAPNDSCFYRIFMLFEASNYQFSKVIRPIKSDKLPEEKSSVINQKKDQAINITPKPAVKPAENVKKNSFVTTNSVKVEKKENIIHYKPKENISAKENKMTVNDMPERKDIVLHLQKHEYFPSLSLSRNALLKFNRRTLPNIQTQKLWKASSYIFTGNDGNVLIQIPDADKKKYSVTFLKEEGRPLFKIPVIKKTSITIDKSSFLKSGWYYFELRESNQVIERNKFLVTKDF